MKFLGINLISENLCNENYKTMMKKMEEDKSKGEIKYHLVYFKVAKLRVKILSFKALELVERDDK